MFLLVVVLAASSVAHCEEESAPTLGDKVEETKETTKDHASQTAEAGKTWSKWASDRIPWKPNEAKEEGQETTGRTADIAKDYATKSAKHLSKTKDHLHRSAGGLYNRWSSWAGERLGKYDVGKFARRARGKTSETAAEVETRTPLEEEL